MSLFYRLDKNKQMPYQCNGKITKTNIWAEKGVNLFLPVNTTASRDHETIC